MQIRPSDFGTRNQSTTLNIRDLEANVGISGIGYKKGNVVRLGALF